jgi:hypothetical protein
VQMLAVAFTALPGEHDHVVRRLLIDVFAARGRSDLADAVRQQPSE